MSFGRPNLFDNLLQDHGDEIAFYIFPVNVRDIINNEGYARIAVTIQGMPPNSHLQRSFQNHQAMEIGLISDFIRSEKFND